MGSLSAGRCRHRSKLTGEATKQARGEKAQRLVKAYRYVEENSTGMADYRLRLGEERKTLRRTGAMEGNVIS